MTIASWGHHYLNDMWRKRIFQQKLFQQSDILWDMLICSPVIHEHFVLFFWQVPDSTHAGNVLCRLLLLPRIWVVVERGTSPTPWALLRRAVWYPAQPFWAQSGKVEPSCIARFLNVRSLNVTGEIMKEKYSAGLKKFNGF